MEYEKMIADRYEVDGKYFADKYNMPVGERLQQANPFGMQQPSEDDKKDDKSASSAPSASQPFFD